MVVIFIITYLHDSDLPRWISTVPQYLEFVQYPLSGCDRNYRMGLHIPISEFVVEQQSIIACAPEPSLSQNRKLKFEAKDPHARLLQAGPPRYKRPSVAPFSHLSSTLRTIELRDHQFGAPGPSFLQISVSLTTLECPKLSSRRDTTLIAMRTSLLTGLRFWELLIRAVVAIAKIALR